MTEHEASETRREARRRRRAERRAARGEARGARGSRNSGIAWAAVLMSVGVAAVVSAMVVTIGAVGVAAKGPGEPRPRAVALWEQRMDATENPGGAGGQAARGRGGSREGARSASPTRTRASGSTRRSSGTPRKRGSAAAPKKRGSAARPGGASGTRRPGSPARPGGAGGAGGPDQPGTIAGLPDPSAAIDLIAGLIGSIGGGKPGGAGGPGGEPGGTPGTPGGSGGLPGLPGLPGKPGGGGAPGGAPGGGAPDPEGLLPGMDALPDFEGIARCIGDLGVPIAPGGGEGGPGLPGLPAPGEGKGPGGLLPVSLVLDQDALAGAGMLQELIADLVATGGITQETIDRLHGRSLALCG